MVDGFVMMLEHRLRSLPRTTRGARFDDYGWLRWLMRLEPVLQGSVHVRLPPFTCGLKGIEHIVVEANRRGGLSRSALFAHSSVISGASSGSTRVAREFVAAAPVPKSQEGAARVGWMEGVAAMAGTAATEAKAGTEGKAMTAGQAALATHLRGA